jgi:hypothetical protein
MQPFQAALEVVAAEEGKTPDQTPLKTTGIFYVQPPVNQTRVAAVEVMVPSLKTKVIMK